LAPAPGSELTVQFIIEEGADAGFSATLNSPDNGAIKNVAASKVDYAQSTLRVEVSDLEGEFEGTLVDGVLDGTWKQLDQAFPLVLEPFVEQALSADLAARITGRWAGELVIPGGPKLGIVMNFDVDENGSLSGTMESPDQGPRQFPMEGIVIDDEGIELNINTIGGRYEGKFAGADIDGTWSQGQSFALKLSRAEFDPNAFALKLSGPDHEFLRGDWWGEVITPVGPVPTGLRFEETEPGLLLGFVESPDQGSVSVPVKAVTIADGAVEMTLAGGRFQGVVVGATIEGELQQGGQKLPLVLQKGTVPSVPLELPAEAVEMLLGSWEGSLKTPQGTTTIVFRFEAHDGQTFGYMDNENGGMKGARLRTVSINDGQIEIAPSAILRVKYVGSLVGDAITGKLQANGREFDLNLKR
jgi:hypothetical protein